jgi:predicted O-methyltransferase YrrM
MATTNTTTNTTANTTANTTTNTDTDTTTHTYVLRSFEEFQAESLSRYQMMEGCTIPLQQERIRKIFNDNLDVKKCIETGFNGGWSCATMLSARPDIIVTSFDLGHWDYVKKAEALIHEYYPDRLKLVYGDSTQTVPHYISENQGERGTWDMAFVDGGHTHPVPLTDLQNIVRDYVRPGGIILLDDYGCIHGKYGVESAWKKMVSDGLIIEEGEETFADRGWVWGRCRV